MFWTFLWPGNDLMSAEPFCTERLLSMEISNSPRAQPMPGVIAVWKSRETEGKPP